MTTPRLIRPVAAVTTTGRVVAVALVAGLWALLFAGFRLAGADLTQAVAVAAALVVGGGLLVAVSLPRRG